MRCGPLWFASGRRADFSTSQGAVRVQRGGRGPSGWHPGKGELEGELHAFGAVARVLDRDPASNLLVLGLRTGWLVAWLVASLVPWFVGSRCSITSTIESSLAHLSQPCDAEACRFALKSWSCPQPSSSQGSNSSLAG